MIDNIDTPQFVLRIIVDCTAESRFLDGRRGFLSVKFEGGDSVDSAVESAINRTKNQMVEKGYKKEDIGKFSFAIEDVARIMLTQEIIDSEGSFVYYR